MDRGGCRNVEKGGGLEFHERCGGIVVEVEVPWIGEDIGGTQ